MKRILMFLVLLSFIYTPSYSIDLVNKLGDTYLMNLVFINNHAIAYGDRLNIFTSDNNFKDYKLAYSEDYNYDNVSHIVFPDNRILFSAFGINDNLTLSNELLVLNSDYSTFNKLKFGADNSIAPIAFCFNKTADSIYFTGFNSNNNSNLGIIGICDTSFKSIRTLYSTTNMNLITSIKSMYDSILVCAGSNGTMYISTDYGNHWSEKIFNNNSSLVNEYSIEIINNKIIIITTYIDEYGPVKYLSTDNFGNSWDTLNIDTSFLAHSALVVDDSTLYFAGEKMDESEDGYYIKGAIFKYNINSNICTLIDSSSEYKYTSITAGPDDNLFVTDEMGSIYKLTQHTPVTEDSKHYDKLVINQVIDNNSPLTLNSSIILNSQAKINFYTISGELISSRILSIGNVPDMIVNNLPKGLILVRAEINGTIYSETFLNE